MSDKKEIIIQEPSVDESGIFGRSKSREEIKTELKAEKRARQEEAKAQRKALREQLRSQPKEPRPELRVLGIVLGVVALLCAAAVGFNIYGEKKNEKFEKDVSKTGYFLAEDATPEMAEDGLMAAVNEVYYTKGGYLCVRMTLGNGTAKDQYLEALEVEIRNGDTDALIAKGYSDKVDEDYMVPTGGTNEYTFYISPEHVKNNNDTLSVLSYDVKLSSSQLVEE